MLLAKQEADDNVKQYKYLLLYYTAAIAFVTNIWIVIICDT